MVIVCDPVTVRSPPVMSTSPEDLIFNLSTAASLEPVEKVSEVAFDVELKFPSDFAVIEAATKLESP